MTISYMKLEKLKEI